jgi:hypothetical protein
MSIVIAFLIAGASSSNFLQDHVDCMKAATVKFERSGEPAETVANAALSSCERFFVQYRSNWLNNRPPNATLTYIEGKKFLDEFWAGVEKRAREKAIQTIVEIRANRASN